MLTRPSRFKDMAGTGVDRMGDAADALDDPSALRLENLDTDLRPSKVPWRSPGARWTRMRPTATWGRSALARGRRSACPSAARPGVRALAGRARGVAPAEGRHWPRENVMSRLRFWISISLDGFVAGTGQSPREPLGKGGMKLHEWIFPLAKFRSMHGQEGGERNEDNAVLEESTGGVGASIMGRNMFGGQPGPWDPERPWDGWWGRNPPFHHPVLVLTHHARPPLSTEGGTNFTFCTGGPLAALEEARAAARGLDVALLGGAATARQFLGAGLVDEMELHLVPVLLGAGERLFEGLSDDLHGLKLVRTVATPRVTHLKFARR